MAYTSLISATELQRLMQPQEPLERDCLVFDCSFDLGQPLLGRQQYLQTHIPGAIYAHLNTDLSAQRPPGAAGGRHPLPAKQTVAAWLTGVGMRHRTQAVVYDRNGANYCGRLWWMLKWLGHDDVAVLDGGLQAWQAAGGATAQSTALALSSSAANPAFAVKPSKVALVTAEQILAHLGHPSQTIIDARGAPRFRGEVEPVDPVAGHIPGALNRPFTANLGADGKFKSPAVLRGEFEALLAGRSPASVVHHCGSGVSAVSNMLAMTIAGLGPTALYAGSWSDWCSRPDFAVARSC